MGLGRDLTGLIERLKEGLSFSRLEIFITRASFAVPEDPQRLCPALQDSLLRLLISRVIYCWGTDTPNLVLFPGLRFCGSVVWAGLSGLSLLCMVYWGHSGSGVWWVASGTAWGPGAWLLAGTPQFSSGASPSSRTAGFLTGWLVPGEQTWGSPAPKALAPNPKERPLVTSCGADPGREPTSGWSLHGRG